MTALAQGRTRTSLAPAAKTGRCNHHPRVVQAMATVSAYDHAETTVSPSSSDAAARLQAVSLDQEALDLVVDRILGIA